MKEKAEGTKEGTREGATARTVKAMKALGVLKAAEIPGMMGAAGVPEIPGMTKAVKNPEMMNMTMMPEVMEAMRDTMDTGTDTLLKFDIRHRAFPVQENSGSCLYEKNNFVCKDCKSRDVLFIKDKILQHKEALEMRVLKKWKKAVAAMLAAVVLSGSFAAPAMAHGHHGSSHHSSSYSKSSKGVYCPYHHKRHKKKSNCKRYCTAHKKIHKNGKRHHLGHH